MAEKTMEKIVAEDLYIRVQRFTAVLLIHGTTAIWE